MATKKNEGKNRYYSVSKKLRKEGNKLDDETQEEFEDRLKEKEEKE